MHANRVTVANGSTLVFPIDYFSPNFTLSVYPTGGSTATVTYTIDDVNDPTFSAIYFALPAPFNVGVTVNTIATVSNTPVRALKFVTTVAGTAVYTVLMPSGPGLAA